MSDGKNDLDYGRFARWAKNYYKRCFDKVLVTQVTKQPMPLMVGGTKKQFLTMAANKKPFFTSYIDAHNKGRYEWLFSNGSMTHMVPNQMDLLPKDGEVLCLWGEWYAYNSKACTWEPKFVGGYKQPIQLELDDPLEATPTKKECGPFHNWRIYEGLTERYEYCEDCDKKRPIEN